MPKNIGGFILISAFVVVIPIRAQNAPAGVPPQGAAAPATATPKPAPNDPNYVIGGQDLLDISVWKEPDVSRAVPVRPDGKISLPLLGMYKLQD